MCFALSLQFEDYEDSDCFSCFLVNNDIKATDQNQSPSGEIFTFQHLLFLHLSWTRAHVSATALLSLVHLLLCRTYHAEKLPKTNLVFIIADAKITCLSCEAKEFKQDEEPCILFFLKTAFIRQRTFTADQVNIKVKVLCFVTE